LINLQGKYEECMNYFIHNKDYFIDRIVLYENIIKNGILCKKIILLWNIV